MTTYLVYSRAMENSKQVFLTEDRVTASSKEQAAAKIEARTGRYQYQVTSVIYVG